MLLRTLDLSARLFDRLRSPQGAFIIVHAANSILGFALTFAQFFVFVRVLEPGFFAQIILLTTAGLYLLAGLSVTTMRPGPDPAHANVGMGFHVVLHKVLKENTELAEQAVWIVFPEIDAVEQDPA